ncbi:MAG: ABC transporter ATP-binding protein [Bacillus sp. (in: firmicutes)]
MISLNHVTGGYNPQAIVVRDVSFTVDKGSFFALLGPNGSGKTTIVRLMMGVLYMQSGEVIIDGKNIKHYKPKELAKKVAVMTQEHEIGLDFTVEEIVNIGRYPYQKSLLFKENSDCDRAILEKVMKQTNVWKYRHKPFTSLSGGEKQRVLLAKALAQEPAILLLDEPTNHLDVRHTMELLDLLKDLQCQNNLTILAILHDLNLASLYANQIGLLRDGQLQGMYNGFSRKHEQDFSAVYEVQMNFQEHPEVAKNQVFLTPQFLMEPQEYVLCNYVHIGRNGLSFTHDLRTLSVGSEGRGITWEKGWNLSGGAGEDEDYFSLTEGYQLYGYNNRTKRCEPYSAEKLASWSTLLLISNIEDDLRCGFVTSEKLDDLQMLNASVQLTSFITEMKLQQKLPSHQAFPFSLLTISSCSHERGGKGEDVFREMVELFHFAWREKRTRISGLTVL